MPKNAFRHCLFLLVIILFSCDQNAACIDADDFGDIEREFLTVYPSIKDECLIPSDIGGNKDNYSGILVADTAITSNPAKVLKDCLTKDEILLNNGPDVVAQLGTKEVDTNFGCLAYSTDTKIMLCESFCESYCYDNSTPLISKPNWKTNTPRGRDSDFGVNITPGSQIFVTVQEGSINLSGGVSNSANQANIASSQQQSSLFFSDNPPYSHTILSSPPFNGKAGYSYTPSISSRYNSQSIINNISDQDRYDILARNIISYTPYPPGYPSVPIEANPETWKCLEGFPNQINKIKCSFADSNGEDNYNSYNSSHINSTSSRTFEVGTDGNIHQMTNYGGFIRFNNDNLGIDENFDLIPSPSLEKSSDKSYDRFIDLKAIDIRCNNFPINISIVDKNNPAKIHYKSDGIILSSSSYTTRNIPFYSDSKMTIQPHSSASSNPNYSNCNVSVKSRKYLDVTMPISGFVQFKMKDLENISYGDLKGNYQAGSQSLQTNFMSCNVASADDKFAQSFYVNTDLNGNFNGIGINCKSSSTSTLYRATLNGGIAQFIGSLTAGTPQTITASTGFSKIQIIKDPVSNNINKIKFFPIDQSSPTSIPSNNFNCTGDINYCSELSCNGGKITGLKAQFDGSSIKALSVICQEYQVGQNQNSCNIYGRIINPNGDKIILPTPPPASPTPAISQTILNQVFVWSESSNSPSSSTRININNSGTPYKISDVYVGLDGYSNKSHSDLTQSSCRTKLNIANCLIDSSTCEITRTTTSRYSNTLSQSQCNHTGNGENGIIIDANFGSGGGGGGNLEGTAGNSSSGGNAGESYINPEFTNSAETSLTSADVNGYIKLTLDGRDYSYNTNGLNSVTLTFPSGINILTYEIRGGQGGKGGDCNNAQGTYAGGAGGKGDYFRGTLDFTEALVALARNNSRNLTFKINIGKEGNAGRHCSYDTSAQPTSPSQNTDTGKLKGGNGGYSSTDDIAGGGAGGSASYIALVRSDDSQDNDREDFLVIAGGGGGGNGAKKAISPSNVGAIGASTSTQQYVRTNELKSNANGFRISIKFSSSTATLTSGYAYDYYEYDDFLTKTELNSDDPLKKLNVNPITYSPVNGIFVRKGQILRILPKTFETLWNSKEGPKECGVGMIMKITPRPAVLCLGGFSEQIRNPSCVAKYETSSATIQATGQASLTAPTSSGQIGCQGVFDCSLSPILASTATANIPATSTYCPNQTCSQISCSGGSADGANTCTPQTPANCDQIVYAADGTTPLYQYTSLTCQNCRTQKENSAETSPIITISKACYNFENKNISVFRFLKQFNSLPSSLPEKIDFINSTAEKISDFNEGQTFGNFTSIESANNNQFFKLKNPISVTRDGEFKGFIITNDEFKNLSMTPPAGASQNVSEITFTTRATYSKGKGLQMYLCKEDEADGVYCNGEDPLPSRLIKTEYINDNPATDFFEFDSSGKIQKKSRPPNICDAYSSSQSDNFICFKDDLGNENEIKKYRLAFKIKDFYDNDYSNNSGNYKIKIEKRNIKSTGSGRIIDGILEPIISNLDGSIDNPATLQNEKTDGIVKGFYLAIIQNSLYRWISSLTIVLALSFYGMGYLMGVNELKHSEIVKILFKIGFIYLFTSTTTGWSWFNKLFIDFFKNGIDYITYSVAENFDRINAQEINSKIVSGDFYNKGILFKSVDNVIDLLLTGAVQKKIMALLFSSIFGWVYFLILFNCLVTYIYAIANSMLLYITCQIVVSILFTLGPIFFIFLMFKITKEIFDNWIKALIGFSLQQIFLIMTLALFNSFVVSFLKLALGYRVCWTNILTLNIAVTKFSIFNFWTIAGVNSPEGYSEDSPEQSFGSDQNMPSIYLFLYLMIIITLMKKFIEMFTNLAVSLSGGLKASTVGGDVNQLGQKAFKAISKAASGLYERTVGRAVANVDNVLFDSGKIADQRRSVERKKFAEDMKTRASLMKAGNDAVSKYKKENALEFAGMDNDQKRAKIESERMKGMQEYAKDNEIDDKKLNKLLNQSGLNYSGTNLFGGALQAAKQASYSGGNLFNSIREKKVDTSFSKTDANAALKNMKETDQKAFLEKVEKGDVHVNKGKIEKIRSGAISVAKAPGKIIAGAGYAILNPKTTMKNVASAAQSVNPFKTNQIKKEAIKQLQDSGKIDKFKTFTPILKAPVPLPNAIKNWARTDEEKKLIRDKMREISKDKGSDSTKQKVTSQSVIKDLKTTIDYTKKIEASGGQKTLEAKFERFVDRVSNVVSKNDPKQIKSDEKTTAQFTELKKSAELDVSVLKAQKDNLIKAEEKINATLQSQDSYKKFNILEKAQKSLESTGGISKEIQKEILKSKDESLNQFLKRNDELNNASRAINFIANTTVMKGLAAIYNNTLARIIPPAPKAVKNLAIDTSSQIAKNIRLDHVKNSLREEVASNPSLLSAVQQRDQFRQQLVEVNFKINSLEERSTNIDKKEQAQKINEKNLEKVKDYEKKPLKSKIGLAIISKISSVTLLRPIARAINSATGNKGEYLPILKEREDYKKAKKSVAEFKKIQTPEDYGNFVEKSKKN